MTDLGADLVEIHRLISAGYDGVHKSESFLGRPFSIDLLAFIRVLLNSLLLRRLGRSGVLLIVGGFGRADGRLDVVSIGQIR